MELYATVRKDRGDKSLPVATSSDGEVTGTQIDAHTGRPVVSYIKIDKDDAKKKAMGQYVSLTGSDGSGSDVDRQTTLKIRRDNSLEGQTGDPMPDVVKRGSRPPGEYRIGLSGSSEKGTPPSVPGGRYVSLAKADPDYTNEPDYSTINKQLSGAHIAHILSDRGSGSPKFTHNTDRLPTTFRQQDGDQPDPENVTRPRSADANRTSSPYSQRTDSPDSSKSGSSSQTAGRGKDKNPYATGPRFPGNLPPGSRENGHASPSSSSTDTSSSSPRLVDEAYGTMGSSSGSSSLRSSSTASTGSGSSGSVVTVIAADNDNSLQRRKMFGPKPGTTDGGKNSAAPYGTSGRPDNRGGGGGGGLRGPHQ